jgi:hypothetical protein
MARMRGSQEIRDPIPLRLDFVNTRGLTPTETFTDARAKQSGCGTSISEMRLSAK